MRDASTLESVKVPVCLCMCVGEEASLPPRDDARLYWQTEEEEKRRRRFHDHQWEEEVS